MICASCGEEAAGEPCASCGESPLLEGRYRLVDLLGRGAHGRTWRAEDTETNEVVAVKELPVGPGVGLRQRELFRREARVLGELEHDALPDLFQAIETGSGRAKTLWIVQELIPGPTLGEELETKRYSEAEVLDIVDELLEVLGWLHDRSPPILHRDVKPSNIIRRESDGRLVLIDFGSVRDALVDADLGGSTVTGTFGYMAPEQYAGDATERSDLYGLAATAVTLLTRRPAPQLASAPGVLAWREHATVSPTVADVLDSMLALDPDARPASVAVARERLRAARGLSRIENPVRGRSSEVAPRRGDLRPNAPRTAAPLVPLLPDDRSGLRHVQRSALLDAPFDPAQAEAIVRRATRLDGRLRQKDGLWLFQQGFARQGPRLEVVFEPGLQGTRVTVTEDLAQQQLRSLFLLGLGGLFLVVALVGLIVVLPGGTLLAILSLILAIPALLVFLAAAAGVTLRNRAVGKRRANEALDGIVARMEEAARAARTSPVAAEPGVAEEDELEIDHDFDDDWDEEVPEEGLAERVIRFRRKERG